MLPSLVRYLHDAYVPFRLISAPSPEHLPKVALALPSVAKPVQTKVILADGIPTLVCFPAGEQVDYAALRSELGAKLVVDGSTADLRNELRNAAEPLPPFGELFGIPLIVDEAVTRSAVVAFNAFDEATIGEVPYDDFARLEHPRVGRFASAGELPEHVSP
jgi:Ala-tRNA(Pro) deacylase